MSCAMVAKIAYQLKSFFEDTEKYARSSPVLKKSAHLSTITFYKNYYRGLAYFNKGMELKKAAEDKGSEMGLAGGMIKMSMQLMKAAEKSADSGTRGAIGVRLKQFKDEYDEIQLQLKNVYYESDASEKELEGVSWECKNFTLYRSLESSLDAKYKNSEAFEIF